MASSSGPTIDMLVLDAIQDDVEQLPSILRMLAEWRSRLDEEYVQDDVLDALRRLLENGLVDAYEESLEKPELVLCTDPSHDASALGQYWFEPTELGRARWDSWQATFE